MYPEAIAAEQEAMRLGGSGSFNAQVSLGVAYAGAGEREKAQAILKRLEASDTYVSPAVLSQLYAALGEREKAFVSLERAYAERDLQLQALGYDPYYDSLRSDTHFKDLMRRVARSEMGKEDHDAEQWKEIDDLFHAALEGAARARRRPPSSLRRR